MECLEDNCNKNAYFNLPNKNTAIYCKIHKKNDMIDIIYKKYIERQRYILLLSSQSHCCL